MFERNNDLERKQLAPGVCITTLDASKFNRCRITLHLRFPAKRESATDAAVLALVLERGYAACPDMTALSRRLAELYGADLGVDLASAGTDRVLSADICGIKDAYALAGENLTDAYADIVFGTIFDPYLVDGAFEQGKLNAQIGEHLRQRIVQLAGNGGALFHQQQLLVMLLRLVKVQPAPEHGRHASHQRKGNAVRLALPAQLAIKGVLHQYRQVLQRDTLSLRPFA